MLIWLYGIKQKRAGAYSRSPCFVSIGSFDAFTSNGVDDLCQKDFSLPAGFPGKERIQRWLNSATKPLYFCGNKLHILQVGSSLIIFSLFAIKRGFTKYIGLPLQQYSYWLSACSDSILSYPQSRSCAIFGSSYYFIGMNIFVGNLTAAVQLKHLRNLFSEFGAVDRVMIVRGMKAVRPYVFCWIIMKERADALRAIKNLDHSEFMQRTISVNEALLAARPSFELKTLNYACKINRSGRGGKVA